jgi:hypothetical protein
VKVEATEDGWGFLEHPVIILCTADELRQLRHACAVAVASGMREARIFEDVLAATDDVPL